MRRWSSCTVLHRHRNTATSGPKCNGARKRKITGNPDREHVSTSHVERYNLTMRRSTRLTNAFSKKVDNHMLSLCFAHYNFCCIHSSLKVTLAMQAGLTDTLHDVDFIVGLVDARNLPPKSAGRARSGF